MKRRANIIAHSQPLGSSFNFTNAEAQAVSDRMEAVGSVITESHKQLIDDFFSDMKSGPTNGTNNMNVRDSLYILANVGDAQHAKIDWITPSKALMSQLGSVENFSTDGLVGNGTQWYSTGHLINTDAINAGGSAVDYSLSLYIHSYQGALPDQLMVAIGDGYTGLTAGFYEDGVRYEGTAKIAGGIRDETATGLFTVTPNAGGTGFDLYRDGSIATSDSVTIQGLDDGEFTIGGGSYGGRAPADLVTLSFASVGGRPTTNEEKDFFDAIENYKTGLAAL